MICPNGCKKIGSIFDPVTLIPGNVNGYYECPTERKIYYIVVTYTQPTKDPKTINRIRHTKTYDKP